MIAGAPSDEILLIKSGAVKVVLSAPNGSESILGLYGCGELIGELGVLSGEPRSATVIGHVDGAAIHVPSEAFRALLAQDRETLLLINETLHRRLRNADHRQLQLASRDVPSRVAAQLLAWAKSHGEQTGSGLVIRGITQRDLALIVTASEKSVEAALRSLRDAGLVETGRCRFTLLDPARLEQLLSQPDWRL
jgi:CRP/FNR family transcriptional regulator, cyclic AMP receptor protein